MSLYVVSSLSKCLLSYFCHRIFEKTNDWQARFSRLETISLLWEKIEKGCCSRCFLAFCSLVCFFLLVVMAFWLLLSAFWLSHLSSRNEKPNGRPMIQFIDNLTNTWVHMSDHESESESWISEGSGLAKRGSTIILTEKLRYCATMKEFYVRWFRYACHNFSCCIIITV